LPALVVVDLIEGFMSLKPESQRIVPSLKRLLDAARKVGTPVIYVNHVLKNERHSRVVEDLKPTKRDLVLEKRDYSAFYKTGLDKILKNLKVKTLIVTGIHTDLCVRHTVEDAFKRGYRTVVPRDCVKSYEKKDGEALEELKKKYRVEVTSSKALIKHFQTKGTGKQ